MVNCHKISSWIVFLGIIFVLSGCVYKEEPELMIDKSWHPEPPPEIQIVRPKVSPSYYPSQWYPPSNVEKKWLAIVIHHSATENGNAEIFDRIHKDYNNWDGVGYDFVIGNGTDSGNGQVEVTFRWRQQKTGAHCKTPNNWANENGIGICLVGDFNKTSPTGQQMQSLAKLVRFLQKRYGVPTSKIYGHNTTPGAHATDCPGSKFPMARLKSML